MKTLNTKGHRERRKLIQQGTDPRTAFEQALSNPDNHSTFKQGRKKSTNNSRPATKYTEFVVTSRNLQRLYSGALESPA